MTAGASASPLESTLPALFDGIDAFVVIHAERRKDRMPCVRSLQALLPELAVYPAHDYVRSPPESLSHLPSWVRARAGCATSHYRAVADAFASDESLHRIAVFEDDAVISSPASLTLPPPPSDMRSGLAYFGCVPVSDLDLSPTVEGWRRLESGAYCTHSYSVGRGCLPSLRRAYESMWADGVSQDTAWDRILVEKVHPLEGCVAIWPPAFHQIGGFSDLDGVQLAVGERDLGKGYAGRVLFE